MSDDKNAIVISGSEEETEIPGVVKLEGLNTLLDSATAALAGATLAELGSGERRECVERAFRLKTELDHAIRSMGSVCYAHTVSVKGSNGLDERYSLKFPVYARGDDDCFRMIDSDMLEVAVVVAGPPAFECGITTKRVDFLDGRGVGYWLGRGVYKLRKQEFDDAMKQVINKILPLMQD